LSGGAQGKSGRKKKKKKERAFSLDDERIAAPRCKEGVRPLSRAEEDVKKEKKGRPSFAEKTEALALESEEKEREAATVCHKRKGELARGKKKKAFRCIIRGKKGGAVLHRPAGNRSQGMRREEKEKRGAEPEKKREKKKTSVRELPWKKSPARALP